MKRMKPGAPPQVSCRSEMVVIRGAHNTYPWKDKGAMVFHPFIVDTGVIESIHFPEGLTRYH